MDLSVLSANTEDLSDAMGSLQKWKGTGIRCVSYRIRLVIIWAVDASFSPYDQGLSGVKKTASSYFTFCSYNFTEEIKIKIIYCAPPIDQSLLCWL